MNSLNTPVLFLIFNRPDTTKKVFGQIKKARPKHLYIAADGPRSHRKNEIEKCNETREIIKQIDWECELKTLFRKENLGCKYAVSSAISWFFENVEEGIIIEDDCYPDCSFFYYCQELLEKYRYATNVQRISGSYFDRPGEINWQYSYYFSYYGHIWGWATWKRVWNKYDVEMKSYSPATFKKGDFVDIFNFNSEYKYWKSIFNKVSKKKIDTWDYQLEYSIWCNKGISINPTKNLVINLGMEDSSTHYFLKDSMKINLKLNTIKFPLIHPPEINLDKEADKFTYTNLLRHSFSRILRIIRENNIKNIFYYGVNKITK